MASIMSVDWIMRGKEEEIWLFSRRGRNLSMPPSEFEDTLAGVQLTSAVDYPGKLCSTLFLGGCNFSCPFCHNGSAKTSGWEPLVFQQFSGV
ncbi:MAG: hypothetical protein QMC95_17750 [Desulfitobacteriaceae bacterium]|nr:hypothetical protein [Desulfitobacteriaceae bacterium]MDI6916028.1 hypothetical protein [Desulfitobacteriaceae bacterium]